MIKRRENIISRKEDFICDFHIHSRYSFDSFLTINKIITISRQRKLDCIAITDHNSIQGAVEAKKNTDSKLMVIIGSEIQTEFGDIIGLFLNEAISSRTFFEVIDEIRSQGGMIVAPHPFKSHVRDYLKYADVIEVMNARISRKMNQAACDYSVQNNIPGIGSSDAHLGYEIGKLRTIYSQPVNTEDDLRKAIMHNNCEIQGNYSPRWVHYISASVGAIKTGNVGNLFISAMKKNLCNR